MATSVALLGFCFFLRALLLSIEAAESDMTGGAKMDASQRPRCMERGSGRTAWGRVVAVPISERGDKLQYNL